VRHPRSSSGRGLRTGGLLLAVVLAGACATSVPRPSAVVSHAVPGAETEQTTIGRLVQRQAPRRPADGRETAGFRLVSDGLEALAVRMALIERAERSIDLQYYIFNGDTAGSLVAERLLAAADRGVRVRVLLDDLGANLGDARIATLAVHENIEMRLFNPLTLRHRWLRYVSTVGEFSRIKHRMHNKLMIVDNQIMITGGRNIGDEYFGYQARDFQDIDILGIGAISARASVSFDEYWNNFLAIPIEDISRRPANPRDLERLRRRFAGLQAGSRHRPYREAISAHPFALQFDTDALTWYWGEFEWLYDPAAKTDPASTLSGLPHLGDDLFGRLDDIDDELLIITPYFIPRRSGMAHLHALRGRGVRVGVLTNSLATTDVLAVHSSYARYRRALLAAGIDVWELRPVAGQKERPSAFVSDSSASLHAKTFVYDQRWLFVGSINLDPRSMNLNAEAGVLLDQTALVAQAVTLFKAWTARDRAYRLALNPAGGFDWQSDQRTLRREPEAGITRRWLSRLIGLLPIESQL
jgi:putative cardiolipin synthase